MKPKKLFKDLKLDDIIYKATFQGVIEEIIVNSVSKYSTTNYIQVNINGTQVFDKDKTYIAGPSASYYLDREEAEFSIIGFIESKIKKDTEDLVIREDNLKTRVLQLEELKKKYNK